MKPLFLAFISIALLSGCASLIHTEKTLPDRLNVGISYYLPKRLHRLIVTAEHLDMAKTKAEYEKLLAAHPLLAAEVNKLEAESSKLNTIAQNTPVGKAQEEALKEAQKAEGIFQAARLMLTDLEKKQNEARKKHIAAMSPKAENPTQCDYFVSMDIQPLTLEPDTRYPFLLTTRHSPVRDDDLNIKTTASGLLTSTNVTTIDRTGDIMVEIAKAVGMFMGLVPPLSPESKLYVRDVRSKDAKPKKEKQCFPTVLTYNDIVDFEKGVDSDGISIKFKNEYGVSLDQLNRNGEFNVDNLDKFFVTLRETQNLQKLDKVYNDSNKNIVWGEHCELPDYKTSIQCSKKNGILYRRDVPYTAELQVISKDPKDKSICCESSTPCESDQKPCKTSIATQRISMPNLSPISLIPAEALLLVTAKNNMGFENGMLVSYETNQPSQVLALVSLPVRLVEGYIGAITNIIKLRFDYKSALNPSTPANDAVTSGTAPKN